MAFVADFTPQHEGIGVGQDRCESDWFGNSHKGCDKYELQLLLLSDLSMDDWMALPRSVSWMAGNLLGSCRGHCLVCVSTMILGRDSDLTMARVQPQRLLVPGRAWYACGCCDADETRYYTVPLPAAKASRLRLSAETVKGKREG